MHRNTYINSPKLLNHYYQVISEPRLTFAGQVTGVEGYVESAASGLVAAVELAHRLKGLPPVDFPQETALGALAHYVSNPTVVNFQPMNVNFGIIRPGLQRSGKAEQERRPESAGTGRPGSAEPVTGGF